MRADALFAALDEAPVVSLDGLAREAGLVVVAPHPDDESLGCGGLIAAALRAGRRVRLIVLSDGCGSHTKSRLFPPTKLRALREEETLAAAEILGLPADAIRFLRLPDASVRKSGPDAIAVADTIAAFAAEIAAGAIFVTWRHDPHCDHEAAAAIVDLVHVRLPSLRILAYPVWGWTLPPATEVGSPRRLFRLNVAADRQTKRRAVMAHRSQTTGLIADDPSGFRLSAEMIDRLCGRFELFIEEAP